MTHDIATTRALSHAIAVVYLKPARRATIGTLEFSRQVLDELAAAGRALVPVPPPPPPGLPPAPGPPVTFNYYNDGPKVSCSVCGATGYNRGKWQDTHRRGHLPCASGCGKLMPVLQNGNARAHGRWPCPVPGDHDA